MIKDGEVISGMPTRWLGEQADAMIHMRARSFVDSSLAVFGRSSTTIFNGVIKTYRAHAHQEDERPPCIGFWRPLRRHGYRLVNW